MEFHELPKSWQDKIRELRRENGRYRTERKKVLAEVARLKAQVTR